MVSHMHELLKLFVNIGIPICWASDLLFFACAQLVLISFTCVFLCYTYACHVYEVVSYFLHSKSLKSLFLYEQQVSPYEQARERGSLGTSKFLPLNSSATLLFGFISQTDFHRRGREYVCYFLDFVSAMFS
jgi:hypothetical protein